ncbi:hypothetical protein Syun_030536 [Stephania yunnanensis]|uniref:NAC domain-containing protein n=1 Tax=Stephania yunnanensis TaxID=152371 RepID=A0AAP0E1T5_9MAGN
MDYLNQLPWGFTFNPTDEELICYLEAKAKNSTLPFVDPIIDFDVYTAHHPSQLHMQQTLNVSSTHLYFYVEKSGIGRTAGNGFWHANTGGAKVMNHLGEVIGYRTSLVYYMYDSPVNDEKKDKVIEKEDKKKGKSPSTKTNWIMNEFRLLSSKSKSRVQCGLYAKLARREELLEERNNNMINSKEQLDNIDENAQLLEQHDQQRWQCEIDDLIGSMPHHQASDQIEQLEQYHPQFEERQQYHDDQIFIDQYDHQQMHLQLEQQQWQQRQNCDNVDNLGLSEDDLRCLLEHSNALQQYDDDDEDGIPEMLWLDEAQLACDEEGNLLNPRPSAPDYR